eukprot:TRINITY_DN5391_c0_g1_i1.p1 TRINITY_DN5391_c0_g1~~TRINITY_DN5391_c0_g1_i1.p1  ORF type:complete len:392 (+),score=17.13 TRINITY_DN5391_c0_g1_i1:45-1178(+)
MGGSLISVKGSATDIASQSQPVDRHHYCQPYHNRPYPTLEDGFNVVQSHVFFRHGDRVQTSPIPCWVGSEDIQWDCSFEEDERPAILNSNQHPSTLFRTKFKPNSGFLKGNCAVGHLTERGYHQHVTNGKLLREAYRETLLKTSGITGIKTRTRAVARVTRSAESLLIGLMAHEAPNVVEMETTDADFDNILPNAYLCPKWQVIVDAAKKTPKWQRHMKEVFEPLVEEFNYVTGLSGMFDVNLKRDCIFSHVCHNKPIPYVVTDELAQRIWDEADWQFLEWNSAPNVTYNQRLGIGFLLKDMETELNAYHNNEEVSKLYLYASHDWTLSPLQIAFGVFQGQWPPYASMLFFRNDRKEWGFLCSIFGQLETCCYSWVR